MKSQAVKRADGAEIATLRLPTHSEHYIAVQADGNPGGLIRSIAGKHNAAILSQFVFAGNQLHSEFIAQAGNSEGPVIWLQGDACADGSFYSMQAVAISGIIPTPVRLLGRTIGFVYEDNHARYCRLSGLLPENPAASRARQARSVFETAAALLSQNGFRFTDTVRTWIYLDHLLEWYDDFNLVRTAFFNDTGIFAHTLPASTGIGARNPYGAAIIMEVLAIQPKGPGFAVQTVVSPLQKPALDYKSSFSRAVEIQSPSQRSLFISGTASIAPDGKTAHRDEPEKQIRLALDAVKAILESRGMNWNDLCRGIAYFKNRADLPRYRKVASELALPPFPLAVAQADICRRDLCFEIEVDAAQICLA